MKRLLKILLIGAIIQIFIPYTVMMSYGIRHCQHPEVIVKSDSLAPDINIKVDSFDLVILPPSSGVQFYKDGIVFLSMSKNEEKMIAEHISFGTPDAYYGIPNDSTVGARIAFSPNLSFPYPCEAFTFTNDFMTLYFTKATKKDKKEKIFKAQYIAEDGKQKGWVTDNSPLSFCSDNYTYTHPALSDNGEIMIFASDRTGSTGGMDLYMTRYEGNQWTDPENLGYLINTNGNEFFPFLDASTNLFFSSDGLPGYGGYDLYISKFNEATWDEPINLSKQINTENDEIAFKINRIDGKSAFFSTRQESDKQQIQLYRISMDSLMAIIETNRLSNILYSMALSENEFPSRKVLAFIDTTRIIPPEIRDTIEFTQKDIVIGPQEEILMQVDTIEIKVVEAPPKEQLIARKEIITESPERPPAVVQPVVEIPVKEPPVIKEPVITEPIVPIIPAVPIVEAPVKEPPMLEKTITEPVTPVTPVVPIVEAPVKEPPLTEKEIIPEARVQVIPTEPEVEPADIVTPELKESSDAIVYKVQIKSALKPLGNFRITVNDNNYNTNEYYYKEEYRYTVGEFSSLEAAVELKNACRQTGYPQAFVASFKNNVRSPKLLVATDMDQKITGQSFETDAIMAMNEEQAVSETKTYEKELPEIKIDTITEQHVQLIPIEPKFEPGRTYISEYKELPDVIIYKVQIKSAIRPLGNWQITVNGTNYYTNEYFYKREYRYTVGEFSKLEYARELQNACRRIGYPKAFVAAFKNNIRSIDPRLFKK